MAVFVETARVEEGYRRFCVMFVALPLATRASGAHAILGRVARPGIPIFLFAVIPEIDHFAHGSPLRAPVL